MAPLHRHQLAWISESAWSGVRDRTWDEPARACLAHWAAQGLPLVVTRQGAPGRDSEMALGLPAPGRWGHSRIALTVARSEVLRFDEFPLAYRLLDQLPDAARPTWRGLCAGLEAAGTPARVYGSFGWHLLTGLDHVRAGSDIDLWLSVSNPAQADAAALCLQSIGDALPRLDGELVFGDGSAVAWREWLAWRAARVKSLLVKTLTGSLLVHSRGWQGAAGFAGAA